MKPSVCRFEDLVLCMSALFTRVPGCYVHVVPLEARRGSDPLKLELKDGCELPCGC